MANDQHKQGKLPARLVQNLKSQDKKGGQSLRIIHLSDLHFGDKHQFAAERSASGKKTKGDFLTLAESLIADLESHDAAGTEDDAARTEEKPPQIVCITGDLTEKALQTEFDQAAQFCRDIASLGPVRVIPGNHDVDWEQRDRKNRMDPWQDFINKFRGGQYNYWTSDARDADVVTEFAESHNLIIAEINSAAWVEKDQESSHRGELSEGALKSLNKQLKALSTEMKESCIKIAIVHHHPILIPDLVEPGRGYDSIQGARHLLRSLRQNGFHLLLHGHKHMPFTFTEDSLPAQQTIRHKYPLFIACGGSASSTELGQGQPNCYNIIDLKWLPGANQYRCHVQTRELKNQYGARGVGKLPTMDWTWEELNSDDRSFRPEQTIGDLPEWRDYDPQQDDDSNRQQQYFDHHGVFPSVTVLPSLTPGQAHEAVVELKYHPRKDLPQVSVESVKWSAGPRFGVYELGKESGPEFRAAFAYYGSMLIQASVTFREDKSRKKLSTMELFIYAQFERDKEIKQ